MAMQDATVTLAAADTGTFTFDTPTGNYGKTLGLTISDGGPPVAYALEPDVDNLDGTSTGTVNLAAAVTGSISVSIFDMP